MALDFQVYVTSSDGTLRRYLPMRLVGKCSWKLERYGNYADCTIATTIPYNEYLQNVGTPDTVQVQDRLEVFFQGQRRYRGYISGVSRSLDEPYTVTLNVYGLSQRLGKLPVDKRYAYPGDGVDVATAFGAVVRDFALASTAPDGGISTLQALTTTPVGITTSTLDGSNASFAQVASSLVNSAGNLAVWGCDVETVNTANAGQPPNYQQVDAVFIRPISQNPVSATHVVFANDLQTESATAELQIADVYNVVKITGGAPKYPNLLYNGSFELPVPQSDDAGNWINNGSFEEGAVNVGGNIDYWTCVGEPRIETNSDASTNVAKAYDGVNFAEMDTPGQSIEQTRSGISFNVGDPYLFSFYAGRQRNGSEMTSNCQFHITNAGGTAILSQSFAIDSPSPYYDYYEFPFVMPAGATGFYVYFGGPDSASDGNGLIVDQVSLYDTSKVYQDGWTSNQNGDATINSIDWVHSGVDGVDSYDGSYSLALAATIATDPGNNVTVQPPQQNPISVSEEKNYIISVRAKLQPGSPNATVGCGYNWWGNNSNSSFGEIDGSNTTVTSSTEWVTISCTTTNQQGDAVNALLPFVRLSNTAQVLLDAVMCQDAGVIFDPQYVSGTGGTNPFVDTGSLTYTIRSDDPMLSTLQYGGGTVPYAGSISQYGLLYTTLSDSTILSVPEAYAYADAYFKANATAYTRPTVVRVNDPTTYQVGDTVQLQGVYAPALNAPILPVVRVQESYDGLLKTTLELEVEQPDLSLILRKLVLQNQGLYGASANPGGAGGSANAGGANINPTGTPSTPSDHKVSLNIADTAPDYLDAKVGVDGTSPLQVSDVGTVRTFSMPAATDANAGYMTQADHQSLTYDSAQVPLRFTTSTALGGDLRGTLPSPTLVAKGPGAGTYGSSTQYPVVTLDANGRVTGVTLQTAPGAGAGSGTVTSVAATVPSALLSVSGSPITVSGTLAITLNTQSANFVFAGPTSGSAATPAFRGLVATDLPTSGTAGAGNYGSSSQYPMLTLDLYGRVTSVTLVTPAYPVTSVAGRTGAVVLSHNDVSGLGTAAVAAISSSTPNAEAVGSAGSVGSTGNVSDAGHTHPMPGAFGASGSGHAAGFVPDPGATAGTTRYLREDATWQAIRKEWVTSFARPSATGLDLTQTPVAPPDEFGNSVTWIIYKLTIYTPVAATGSLGGRVYAGATGDAAFGGGTDLVGSDTLVASGHWSTSTTAGFNSNTVATGRPVAFNWAGVGAANAVATVSYRQQ